MTPGDRNAQKQRARELLATGASTRTVASMVGLPQRTVARLAAKRDVAAGHVADELVELRAHLGTLAAAIDGAGPREVASLVAERRRTLARITLLETPAAQTETPTERTDLAAQIRARLVAVQAQRRDALEAREGELVELLEHESDRERRRVLRDAANAIRSELGLEALPAEPTVDAPTEVVPRRRVVAL